MFWLTIGILVGIYLDQTFTIPHLQEYFQKLQNSLKEKESEKSE